MSTRSRAYTFTINNHTFEDLCDVVNLVADYIVFGFEVGEDGTPHIQGYVHFSNARHFKSVSKMLPRAHIEVAKGSPIQNRTYCTKGGEYYEFGECPQQGKCTWARIEAAMNDPKSDPFVYKQYNKMYKEIKSKERKDHQRILNIIRYEDRFHYAKRHSTVLFDITAETYGDEEAIFLAAYLDKPFIEEWCNGYPPKIKRGYELITVDPEYIYLMYTDMKERNYLVKKYGDYIENVYDEKEP